MTRFERLYQLLSDPLLTWWELSDLIGLLLVHALALLLFTTPFWAALYLAIASLSSVEGCEREPGAFGDFICEFAH